MVVEPSTNIVWTCLKRFWKGLALAVPKIYTLWGLFSKFFDEMMKTWIFSKIKHLKNGVNLDSILTSKKAFLKTPREHFMVSLRKRNPSKHMLYQSDFFLMTKAFEWWLAGCRGAFQKVSAAQNGKVCDFHKKLRGRLQNLADMEIMAVASTWNFFVSNATKIIYRCHVTLKRIHSWISRI